MQIVEELNRLNKLLDLNLDLMSFQKGDNSKEEHMYTLGYRPIKMVKKRNLNECLSKYKSKEDLALKLDLAKEIDIANTEIKELADMFRKITHNTMQLINELKKECPSSKIIIFIESLDILVKELQKEGLFLTKNQGAEIIFRDIFKSEISEWQKLSRVFMLMEERSVIDFIGGDKALERRIEEY